MNKRKIKILTIILFIVLVLLLALFLILNYTDFFIKPPKKEKDPIAEETRNAIDNFTRKLEARNREIEKQNTDFSRRQKSTEARDFVMAKHYSLKPSDCEKIVDKEFRGNCEKFLLIEKYINNANRKACDTLEDEWRDCCIRQINSITMDNWKDCKEVKNELMHDWCIKKYAIDNNDIELCNYLFSGVGACVDRTKALNNGWGGDIRNCADIIKTEYFLMCVNQTNDDCMLLEDEYLVKRCESNRYYGIILQEGTKEDCKSLPLETFRRTCEMYFENNKKHIDFDGDGVDNGMELFVDTNPLKYEEEAKEHAWYENRWGDVFDNVYYKTFDKLQPLLVDTDDDGLRDYEEIEIYKSDPENQDTDGDGYSDGEEVINGHDPI